MHLKPHQAAFVRKNPDKAIMGWSTRSGKTFAIAHWAKKRPHTWFILACPKRIVGQWKNDLKLCGTKNVTVVSKEDLKKTNLDRYNGFIFDECFVAGTKLWGGKNIEDIREGDLVRNVFEFGWVTKVHKIKSDTVVRINGNIECTPNHPFLTPNGWTRAIDLQSGESMLHFDYENILRSVWKADQKRSKEILQFTLLDGDTGDSYGAPYKNEKEKSDVYSKKQRENEANTETNRTLTKNSWGQWARITHTATYVMCRAWGWVAYGIRSKNGGTPSPFQNRHSQSIGKDCGRGGWKFSWPLRKEKTRREERKDITCTRVESVEILKRPSTEFFNLSVSGHPSYVLESGIVVHNCHHLASGLYDKPSMLTKCVYEWLRKHPEYPVLLASATPIASKPSNLHTLATLTGHAWDWRRYRDLMYELVRRPYAPFPFWEPRKNWRELIKPLAKEVVDIVLLSDVMEVPSQKHDVIKVILKESTKKAIKEFAALNPSDEWYGRHKLAQGEEKLQMIRELSEGEQKVIVVCKYTSQIQAYERELSKDREVFVLDGHTKDPAATVQAAHDSTECYFLMQSDCAEGFRGDSFNTMIFASMSWRTVSLDQAYGRMLHLDKQSGNQYYYLIADDKDGEIYQRVVVSGQEYSIAGIAAHEK